MLMMLCITYLTFTMFDLPDVEFTLGDSEMPVTYKKGGGDSEV